MRLSWITSSIVLLAILGSGCMIGFKRGVIDNTFYSNNPKMAIKVAKSFEYVNKDKNVDMAGEQNDALSMHNYDYESYFFVDLMDKRGSSIELKSLGQGRVRWVLDHTLGIDDYIEAGHEYKQGKRYGYVVFTSQTNGNDCQLVKIYSRISGGNGNVSLSISYYEVVSEKDQHIFNACQEKGKKLTELTPTQRKIYDKFIERCNKDIAFIDPSTVDLKKNEL